MLKIRTLGRVCVQGRKIIKEAKGESKKVSIFTSVAHPKTHFMPALFKYVHAPISLLLIAIIYLININSVGHSIYFK